MKRKPLAQTVVDNIIQTITEKNLQPGDKLPNEFELAAQLGVGRSTVREAVKTLVSRGVVEIRLGAGTFVSRRGGVSEDPLGLQLLEDDMRVASDLLELRFMLEPRLASLAASNSTPEQLTHLLELCDACEVKLLRGEPFESENTAFHAALAQASGNVVMPNLAVILCRPPSPLSLDAKAREALAHSQREVMHAVAAQDAIAAYDAMLLHLAQYRRCMAEQALR